MLTVIVGMILGAVFTFITIENSQEIPLSLLGTTFILPVFVILGAAFLVGVTIASIFSMLDWTSTAFELKKKENTFNNALKVNDTLRKDVEQLQNENINLNEELKLLKTELSKKKKTERAENIKKIFHRITHPNSHASSQLS